jgi:tetratricopeptide (TPR) repeat protein
MVFETEIRLTMKTTVVGLMLMLSLGSVVSRAQDFGANPDECKKYRSIYGIFMNDKKYKEALPAWRKVLEICPKSGEDIYQNGRYIYKSVLLEEAKAAKDTARQREIQDTIIMLSEKWMEYFGKDVKKLSQLGVDYMMYNADKSYKKATPVLKEVIDTEKENTPYYVITYYFQSVFYARKNKAITDDQYIDEYLKISDLVDQCIKAHPEEQPNLEKTMQNIESLLVAVIKDCEKIEKVMAQLATKLPTDCAERAAVLKKYLAFMNRRKCEEIASFRTYAEELFKCEPSHEAAYNLAAMYLKEKNYAEGLKYIKQAIELCKDCPEAGKYNLAAAKLSLALGNAGAARSYATQSIAHDASESYEIIAKAIVAGYAGSCGNDIIARKSVYWLASDYMQKAGKGANYYQANFPDKTELFENGVAEGSGYTVPCLGESTTVRSK